MPCTYPRSGLESHIFEITNTFNALLIDILNKDIIIIHSCGIVNIL